MIDIYLKPMFLYEYCRKYWHISFLGILNNYKNMNKLRTLCDRETIRCNRVEE